MEGEFMLQYHFVSSIPTHSRPYTLTTGNPMWKYLKNSLKSDESASDPPKHQLERKVSFNRLLNYEVQEDKTIKTMITPEKLSVFFIRKWAAVWPQDGETIPDFGYISVMPCRPDGFDKPQECCRFEVTSDPEEDHPESTTNEKCLQIQDDSRALYLGQSDDSTVPLTAMGKSCAIQHDTGKPKYPTIGCTVANTANPIENGKMILGKSRILNSDQQENYTLFMECEFNQDQTTLFDIFLATAFSRLTST